MTKYIAKLDGQTFEFTSKREVSHVVIASGKCFSKHGPQDGGAGIFAVVGRPDLVPAAEKKAARLYPTVTAVEVEIAPLVTPKFKRDLAALVGF